MNDLVKRALKAKRESKRIEFKRGFDASSPGEWCELIKDIVAIANSGGGIVVFGLDSVGAPTGESVQQISAEDPANIANKLAKYIGTPTFEFESVELKKQRHDLHALVIFRAAIPHVFQKPGTYDIGGGKQKSAFGVGTIYFRHGAKSEPGNSDDIRNVIEYEVDAIRKSWIRGVRHVVQAPAGSEFVVIEKSDQETKEARSQPTAVVRTTKDPSALPVLLTRDRSKATGTIYHEEISEGIFEEINNVVDANRALAKGQKRFFLGPSIYYRIYAERQHVFPQKETLELLASSAVVDFYAPGLFWMLNLPDATIAHVLIDLYRRPISPQIHSLLRLATILGDNFSEWLFGRLSSKWASHAQPPSFYWTFKGIVKDLSHTDYRLRSSRFSIKSRISVPGDQDVNVSELLDDPSRASTLLSKVCMGIFEGNTSGESRTTARNLDYLAYGPEIRNRATTLSNTIINTIGDQQVGELADTSELE
jgi:Putative DNA-binding domain